MDEWVNGWTINGTIGVSMVRLYMIPQLFKKNFFKYVLILCCDRQNILQNYIKVVLY